MANLRRVSFHVFAKGMWPVRRAGILAQLQLPIDRPVNMASLS
jgi:hypothetical protein